MQPLTMVCNLRSSKHTYDFKSETTVTASSDFKMKY